MTRIFESENKKTEYYKAQRKAFSYSKPAFDKAEQTLRAGLTKYGITGRGQDAVVAHIIPDPYDHDWMDLDEAIEAGIIGFSTIEKRDATLRANKWYNAEVEKIVAQSEKIEGDEMEKYNG